MMSGKASNECMFASCIHCTRWREVSGVVEVAMPAASELDLNNKIESVC